MNKILSTLVIISPLVAIALANPALAGESKPKNYVGVTLQSNSTATFYGLQGKVGVADNISVRPFITFGSRTDRINPVIGAPINVNTSLTSYGASIAYDLSLTDSPLNAYAGIGYVGVSANLTGSNGVASSSAGVTDSGTFVELGADYQIGGNIILNANYKTNLNAFAITAGYSF